MADYLNLYNGSTHYGTHELSVQTVEGDDTTFHIDLARVPGFINPTRRRRRPRRPDVGPVQRFLDPSRDHPFLRSLMEAVGPILQGFISTQLPALLGSLMPDVDADEIPD